MIRLLVVSLCLAASWPLIATAQTTASDRQIAVLMMVDYARSYGYQIMMARIQLERDRAQTERDEQVLKQKQELVRRRVAPPIELEIAQLKDTWNRAQLVVAEKSLEYVQAEYDAMVQLAKHYGGNPTSIENLYAIFKRGWDAGCEKGPVEVSAAKARFDFMEKVVVRAQELHARKNEALTSLLEKQAQLEVARAEYKNRSASVDRCRTLLYPSLGDVQAIKP